MIYLFTGAPGSGKTLSAMEFIAKVKSETPDRIIYAANVDGLNIPGVIHLDDDGILAWHEACEKNSIVVVDEAQRYWRAQRSGEPSKAVIEMETHRHDGIDIVLMTQHPTFLHSNIRKLTNHHTHLVAYTKTSSLRWEWRECHDDIQEAALRSQGEFKEWHYPVELFDWYTSATQHTKRTKRPLKQLLGRLGVVFAALVFVGFVGYVAYAIRNYNAKKAQVDALPVISASNPMRTATGGGPRSAPISTKDYLVAQLPRIPSQPWSAPLYDGQAVTQHPRVWCIAPEIPDPCRCITEQGTRYAMDDALCRQLATGGGTYDPYLPEKRDRDTAPAPMPTAQQVMGAAVPAQSSLSYVAASSHASVGSQVYQPPTYLPWNADAFGVAKR
jgi:hypothetical protein